MDCNTCKEKQKQVSPVAYFVHEAEMSRLERANKRAWITCIILILALIISNAAWIWYESQFIEEEWTFEASTEGGGNAIANGNGEVHYYGEVQSYPQDKNP